MDYFFNNNLVSICQHAYREGHSTSTALAHMTNDWLTQMDNKKLVEAVMLDFSAAFNIIDHTLLIGKLQCYGFTSDAISWFNQRKQRVFFNGSNSNWKVIDCGVPQSSCLGLLLYSIVNIDLLLCMKNVNTVMYADDTTLYGATTFEHTVTHVLSDALIYVYKWVECNKLALNFQDKVHCVWI